MHISSLLQDYRLIVVGRFACPIDLESYAGGTYAPLTAAHATQVKG